MKAYQGTDDKEKIRSFIGITFPGMVISYLKALQYDLKKYNHKASWPKPANMHLTLKFLGDIHTESIPCISRCISRAASRYREDDNGLRVMSKGLGFFPSRRKPKIVWAGISGDTDRLARLHSILDECLEKEGFKKDKKKYSPHITLCRIKQKLSQNQTARILDDHGNKKSDLFTINTITLFKSRLEATGAVHTELFSERF